MHSLPLRRRYGIVILFMCCASLFLQSCKNQKGQPNLKNVYQNDLEGYSGWSGVNGYYNLMIGEARSGRHCLVTDTGSIFTMTYAMPLSQINDKPVKSIDVSVWVKCLSAPANGSYVVSIERGTEILKYMNFDLSAEDAGVNEWQEIKGTAKIPPTIPKDAVVKIYFWNKSKATILVDDFRFVVET